MMPSVGLTVWHNTMRHIVSENNVLLSYILSLKILVASIVKLCQ